MKKRVLSCLMALALCMTLLPTAALAEGKETEVTTADALATALNGDATIIKLTANIEISTMLKVNRTVTLDLNDHVLKMTGTGRVIEVESGGNLTLTDSTPNATYKFGIDESTKLWILDETSGTNTVNGGVITGGNTGGNTGGGVRIVSGGAFTMTGGNIVGCTAGAGGGVDVRGTFTMTGGSIAGCVATNGSGGGVFVEDGGTFAMTGGSVAGCTAVPQHMRGGGICNAGTTTLSGSAKIQNCHVQNNGYGGGVFSASGKNLTVNHVEITDCKKGTTPDAMHFFKNGTVSGGIFDGEVTNQGGTISGGTFNSRVVNEGNIENGMFNGEVVNQSNCTIKDGTFKNTVDNFGTIGGGTFTETSTVNNEEGTIEKGEFSGKVENQTGGTIGGGTFSGTVENAAKGKITDGTFTETSTVNNKGTIEKGKFSGTVENQNGGTIGGGMFSGTVTNNGTISGGTFAVTFETEGGNTVPVQNILNGQKATKPDDPTKTGYAFDGWYTEEACTNLYEFTTPVTNVLTLYAKWTINQYTITFKPENGDRDTTITQDYGTAVTAPANPTRTGYTFAGWDREIPATMPAENMTVTAQWTAVGSGSSGSSGGSSREDREPSYAVSAPSKTENGTVSVNTKNARQGDRVTLTAKADPGHVLETLTVLDSKGKALSLTDKGGGMFTFTMPNGQVEVKAVFAAEVKTAPFRDVPVDAYYYDAVKWAAEKGITTGQANGLFGSDRSCTRAQIITFLWRAAGSPVVNYAMEMGDVSADAYYAEAVRWALSRGITSGTGGGAFSPDDACTRAQAVTLLARALSAKAGSAANFTDVPADAYYAQAVSWAVENGITTGVGGGRFDPNATCTRAQIATFLYRLYLSR